VGHGLLSLEVRSYLFAGFVLWFIVLEERDTEWVESNVKVARNGTYSRGCRSAECGRHTLR
jgi:hypothetical protein